MLSRAASLLAVAWRFSGPPARCFALGGDNPLGGHGAELLPDGVSARGLVTDATDNAIDRGLQFLALQQGRGGRSDGSFGNYHYESNIAITSLAGLAFMAAGNQPNRGPYGHCVNKVLQFLVRQAQTQPLGYLHAPARNINGAMYGHGFATLLLAEACGMVQDKRLASIVRECLKQAVQVILNAQNGEGGWRYVPFASDADLSVTVCQMMALRSARNAGIAVPSVKVANCVRYVKKCQLDNGAFRYQLTVNRNNGTGFARTAAGVSRSIVPASILGTPRVIPFERSNAGSSFC